MSTEFRPIETRPARSPWPYAVLGAAVAALAMFILHRTTGAPAPQKPAALANIAPADLSKAPELKLPEAKPAEGPNVLGAAAAAAGKLAMVARAEFDRELGRTQAARREAASYKKQIDELSRQLNESRAQVAAITRARQPAPPSDREQILQMLAPVLKASNDGRP
jgi:hypothetical protein